MKRSLVCILVSALIAAVLVSCAGTGSQSPDPAVSLDPAESGIAGESRQEDPDPASLPAEESKPDENLSGLEIMYCSFSEKPYFAMVGRCAEGATVFGESEGFGFSSLSWHGWFSLRLKCSGSKTDVTVYQQVDGKTVGEPYVFEAKPKTPDPNEMWPIVTGGDFRFFFQKMLPDLNKTNLPSEGKLNALTTRVTNRVNAIKSYNTEAEVIYLIAPSAMTVFPELVPDIYDNPDGESRLDKVINALRSGGATVIDVRDAFAEHKNDEMPLYYYLDSHWSDYGAFVAYTELFEHIAQKYPAAAPRPAEDFDWHADFYDSGDMTYYLAMSQTKVKEFCYYRTFKADAPAAIASVPRYRRATSLTYSDDVTRQNVINTGRSELPSALILRDSYSTQLYDILAERFNVTHYMGMWDYNWNNNLISSEKPDYVIYVIAEWNADSIING